MSEFDSAGGMTGSDSGMSSQMDAGSQSPQGSSGESSGTPPAPDYMTRQAFEEAIGGLGSQYQERFDKMQTNFSGLEKLLKDMYEQSKPKPPALIPEQAEFEKYDAGKVRELLSNLHKTHEDRYSKLSQDFQDFQAKLEMKEKANQNFYVLSKATDQACRAFPKEFGNPGGRAMLERQIVAHLHGANGDISKVNVGQIAAELANWHRNAVKSLYEEKIRSAGEPPPETKPGKGASSPPKGAPSKPGTKDGGNVSGKNFRQQSRAFLEQWASSVAGDREGH